MTGKRPAKLPERDECLRILRDAGCSEEVIEHCIAVAELAVKMARRCEADVRLVEAGALLHDIGRGRTHGIAHAVEGADLAKDLGLPRGIVWIIERHIGGGITKGEAERLGLPARNYLPDSLEEKLVAHADNLIAGNTRVAVGSTVNDLVRRGLADSARRVVALHKEMSAACGMDVDRIP